MARDKGTLWATARCGKYTIPFYKNPKLKGCDGYTYCEAHGTPTVEIRATVFAKPEYFDEVLTHEMVHVCEFLYSAQLREESPEDCSQYAIILGKRLSQMLRTLTQV